MDTRRLILYGAFGLILFLLWQQWHAEHPPKHPAAMTPAATATASQPAWKG